MNTFFSKYLGLFLFHVNKVNNYYKKQGFGIFIITKKNKRDNSFKNIRKKEQLKNNNNNNLIPNYFT